VPPGRALPDGNCRPTFPHHARNQKPASFRAPHPDHRRQGLFNGPATPSKAPPPFNRAGQRDENAVFTPGLVPKTNWVTPSTMPRSNIRRFGGGAQKTGIPQIPAISKGWRHLPLPYNSFTKRGDLPRQQSKISWTQVEPDRRIHLKYPSVHPLCAATNSRGEVFLFDLAICRNGHQQGFDSGTTRMIHLGQEHHQPRKKSSSPRAIYRAAGVSAKTTLLAASSKKNSPTAKANRPAAQHL